MEPYDKTRETPVVDGAKNTIDKITERVNVMLGGEGKVDLRLGDLFSQVFKRHSQDEADELFICGTKYTTPTPDKISSSWPKPWLFSRVAVILLATFYILLACFDVFENEFAIPGIMFVGSLAIPFSTLIFLFEINAPRNVSIFRVVNVFILRGSASLFVTLIQYQIHSQTS
ncbi:MAG: PrsW family intramembrane metalloprotease, partial [Thermoguttaceae bacterium]|nr:PrsW family intramembrane metalloprotease [Thermoguttaceae bacterium]